MANLVEAMCTAAMALAAVAVSRSSRSNDSPLAGSRLALDASESVLSTRCRRSPRRDRTHLAGRERLFATVRSQLARGSRCRDRSFGAPKRLLGAVRLRRRLGYRENFGVRVSGLSPKAIDGAALPRPCSDRAASSQVTSFGDSFKVLQGEPEMISDFTALLPRFSASAG